MFGGEGEGSTTLTRLVGWRSDTVSFEVRKGQKFGKMPRTEMGVSTATGDGSFAPSAR
jgi:hypothetical protein